MNRRQMTKDESNVLTALQLISLDGDDLARLLPRVPEGLELEIFQTNFRTDNALFCVAYEAYRWFEIFSQRTSGEIAGLFSDLTCVLDSMFASDPIRRPWVVEASGPVNRLWSVLRTLARLVLSRAEWPKGEPKIDLQEWITVGRWVPKRVASTRRCLNAFGSLSLQETGFTAPVVNGDTLEVGAVDVGLRPGHPWYTKPPTPEQFLGRCKLIFRGVVSSTRTIIEGKNRSTGGDPREHVLIDFSSASLSSDESFKTFDFTGTMINLASAPRGPVGNVRWTVKAKDFELVDEDWRETTVT